MELLNEYIRNKNLYKGGNKQSQGRFWISYSWCIVLKPRNLVDLGTKAKLLLSDLLFPNKDVEASSSHFIQFYRFSVTCLQTNVPFHV